MAHWLGVLLDEQGELEAGLRFLERSLAIWRELGDRDQQARGASIASASPIAGWATWTPHDRCWRESTAITPTKIGSDYRLAGALTNLAGGKRGGQP